MCAGGYYFIKWTNLGQFAAGMPEWDRFKNAVTLAMGRTQSAYDSDESAFTWPRTQEGLDQRYPDKEALVIDGEEAGERVMGLLREGIWLQEEEEEEESFPVLDEFGRPCSPSPYGSQGFTMGETIASLSQKLTPDTEEDTTAEDDIDMAEASRETDAEGNKEEPNRNRKGPSGEDKGKRLDASQHAPSGEGNKRVAGTAEGEKGGEGGKPKLKGRYKLIDGRNLSTLVNDIVRCISKNDFWILGFCGFHVVSALDIKSHPGFSGFCGFCDARFMKPWILGTSFCCWGFPPPFLLSTPFIPSNSTLCV